MYPPFTNAPFTNPRFTNLPFTNPSFTNPPFTNPLFTNPCFTSQGDSSRTVRKQHDFLSFGNKSTSSRAYCKTWTKVEWTGFVKHGVDL